MAEDLYQTLTRFHREIALPDIERTIKEPLERQITSFLERAVLSSRAEAQADRARVNLLTLHATKGLEFSRVYVLGVEDAQFLGDTTRRAPEIAEVEEARRLLYVGMTRAKDRVVLTRCELRGQKPTGGHQFLDEMELVPSTVSG